jgi:hypothetical protein
VMCLSACAKSCSGCEACSKSSGVDSDAPAFEYQPPQPPAPEPQPLVFDSGAIETDARAEDAAAAPAMDAARPPYGIVPTKERELGRLAGCCDHFESVGRRAGQDGVGLLDLASACRDTLSDLKRGAEPQIPLSDRATYHRFLEDPRVSAACKAIMLRFLP